MWQSTGCPGAIEQVIASHPAVAECAVIGVADPLKGQRASAYVVLKAGADSDEAELARELVALVRKNIGPVADFKHATVVQALPKTRSGKILRKTMRQLPTATSTWCHQRLKILKSSANCWECSGRRARLRPGSSRIRSPGGPACRSEGRG